MVHVTPHTTQFGWQLYDHEVATSTSDIIFDYPPLREGLAVLARQQTKGRGRQGRAWSSLPNDGMYLSVVLCPERARAEWPTLAFIAALSLKHALAQIVPDLQTGLKWPNDILADHKKLSGLLLEARDKHLIIGCGVNLKNAPVIEGANYPPTDIAAQIGTILDPAELALIFLDELYHQYQKWQLSGFSAFYDLYKSQLLFVGECITVNQGPAAHQGILEGVRDDGALLLRLEDGALLPLTAGDVNLMGKMNAASD